VNNSGLMLVSCGVLFFFQEKQVKELFIALINKFPGCEFAFDTMSKLFIWIGNWVVLKKSDMGNKAVMKWCLKSSREILKWNNRITMVSEYPMFSRIQFDESWGKAVIKRMQNVNRMRGINIFHLKLGESQ
jgi:O-methyltransferase involved in polyketide biosynthesis